MSPPPPLSVTSLWTPRRCRARFATGCVLRTWCVSAKGRHRPRRMPAAAARAGARGRHGGLVAAIARTMRVILAESISETYVYRPDPVNRLDAQARRHVVICGVLPGARLDLRGGRCAAQRWARARRGEPRPVVEARSDLRDLSAQLSGF